MRFIFYFFLLLFGAASAQINTNISVISAEKLNVVYRGVDNPIKIAVPGIPSEKIKVSAPGIRKGEGEGNYILTPGAGNEVKVIVTYPGNDSIMIEEKIFRIKGIPRHRGTIDGVSCENCVFEYNKNNLKNAHIGVKFPDFLYIEPWECTSFSILVMRKNIKIHELSIKGSYFNDEAKAIIDKLKTGDFMMIIDIQGKPKEVAEEVIFESAMGLRVRIVE